MADIEEIPGQEPIIIVPEPVPAEAPIREPAAPAPAREPEPAHGPA